MQEVDAKELGGVLNVAWRQGIAVQGRFFRDNANLVAAAASMNLLTTLTASNTFGNTWRITSKGLRLLNEVKG